VISTDKLLANLNRRGFFHIRPGLTRIERILAFLQHPEQRFSTVHIAGTNGKGSVGATLANILRHAGYRTGVYTSPHLIRVNERIQVGINPISDRDLCHWGEVVLHAERSTRTSLTYFEFVTVVAFLYFADARIEVGVIECGMGGLWDATNVLPRPLLSIITSIGLDHTNWLGKTETAIATQKAGIIKDGTHVISGVRGVGKQVIQRYSLKNNAELSQIDTDFKGVLVSEDWSSPTQYWSYIRKGHAPVARTMALMGKHQIDNAAVVKSAVDTLRKLGWGISAQAEIAGFRSVSWPGRLQRFKKAGHPIVLIDGAHNPPAIQILTEILRSNYFKNKKMSFIFTAFKDKDVQAMSQMLQDLPASFFLCSMGGERGMGIDELAMYFKNASPALCETPIQAFQEAIRQTRKNGIIVVAGSLMLVGNILEHLHTQGWRHA